jgi:hypothetical protein
MDRKTMFASALSLAIGVTGGSAFAAPPTTTAAPTAHATEARASAHASLRLDVSRAKAWVGQSLPITLRAYFRGAESITLEGTPQLTSSGVFTSDLAREPRQSTEIIGGESVVVASWTGTMTPSSPAPLEITAELPVHLRYRDPTPQVEMGDPFGGADPFGDMANNPLDTSMFDRFLHQSMRQPLGRAHDEAVTLRASTGSIDVRALPTVDQPASFSGAIGHFDVSASVSSTHAHVSEPVTLRIAVSGDGDLDRVDLAGVATSDAWKAYPPKSTVEPAAKGKRARKIFEQVIVPLHNGDLSIPSVAFATFDPDSNRYVTRDTAPLSVVVDGVAMAIDPPRPALSSEPVLADVGVTPPVDAAPIMPAHVRPTKIALWLSPIALIVAAIAFVSRLRRKRVERSLRRTMRSAASKGDVVPFYHAAHELIETRLSQRWGVSREHVSPPVIRERLGADGDALALVLAADQALRFGRAHVEATNLVPLCASIERSLGGAL